MAHNRRFWLSRRVGAELWVKHENYTPIGAFKLPGGLLDLDGLQPSDCCLM